MKKTNFNMQLTLTEKEIMNYVTDVIYGDFNYSKADIVSILFKKAAIQYLNYGFDWNDISDEELLIMLKQKKKDDDKSVIHFIGTEQYKQMIEKFKVEYPENDTSYMEMLLSEVEKELEDNKNE